MSIFKNRLISGSAACLLVFVAAIGAAAQGKNPVILIPGLTGSELIDKSGKKAWFNVRRLKTDDLKLPISPNLAANHDSLTAGDIIRRVRFALRKVDVYGGLIEALENAGYREMKWDSPGRQGYENAVYVFAYDWRRDNVENARLLIRRIETLKRRLRRPNLKFDLIGHSMGGIIARYAAMYGNADLPAGNAPVKPTWAGAKDIDRIILLGTPNEGSTLALRELVNGSDLVGVGFNLPFIQRFSRFDVFTIPTAFELLPAPGTLRAFDESFKPIDVDIYDPAVWSQYGWNAIDDKDFEKHFTPAEQRNAKAYFSLVLDRAKRLHEALDAAPNGRSIPISLIGSECKDTLDSIMLIREKDGWRTLFKADSFTNSAGQKVTSEELKKVIYAPGDGVVTRRSLLVESLLPRSEGEAASMPQPATFVCESHDSLPRNPEVQTRVLAILSGVK